MALSEVKPCPFCGADGEELGRCYDTGPTPAEGQDWFIRCYVCHVETERVETAELALTRWNTRSGPDERVKELVEALQQIFRMKTFPDDKTNTFTLAMAHRIADEALSTYQDKRP